jgi:hypothetical protein
MHTSIEPVDKHQQAEEHHRKRDLDGSLDSENSLWVGEDGEISHGCILVHGVGDGKQGAGGWRTIQKTNKDQAWKGENRFMRRSLFGPRIFLFGKKSTENCYFWCARESEFSIFVDRILPMRCVLSCRCDIGGRNESLYLSGTHRKRLFFSLYSIFFHYTV